MAQLKRIPALAILLALCTANTPPESRIELSSEAPTVTMEVNGRATMVEVAPDGPGSPIVNTAVARELGFKGSLIAGAHLVGTTRINANSNLAQLDFGNGTTAKRRVFWFERDWTRIAEGRVGPMVLPYDVVSYRLRPSLAGEREITLPMEMAMLPNLSTRQAVNGVEIRFVFAFDRPQTMLTASAGALLAESNRGRMVGDAYPMLLEMGIMRPVRAMEFDQPVMLGTLPLRNLVVRTQDTGSTAAIPDKSRDPDEIVVTGGKNKKAGRQVIIGTDSLRHCSMLTFDKPARLIRLSCLPAAS